MSDPLLTIRNHHVVECGDAPIITGSIDNQYTGYFENPFGEQWIFTFDRKSGKGVLRGGDVGWDSKFEVVGGRVVGLIVGKEEGAWLHACWSAATASGSA